MHSTTLPPNTPEPASLQGGHSRDTVPPPSNPDTSQSQECYSLRSLYLRGKTLSCGRTGLQATKKLRRFSKNKRIHVTSPLLKNGASQVAAVIKDPPTNAGDVRDTDSVLGSGRCPGGHGSPLQDPYLENPHGPRSLEGYSAESEGVGHD